MNGLSNRCIAVQVFLLCLWLPVSSAAEADDPVLDELNAYWEQVSRTVSTGDFDTYSRGYHEDAVYVSESDGLSKPIASVLEGWRQGFLDTQQGKTQPTVEFRFSQRLHDSTSAHESGIFRYSSNKDENGEGDIFIHFEALLVKKEQWLTLMEYQKSPASKEEWDAL